jgi:hypothetical protein
MLGQRQGRFDHFDAVFVRHFNHHKALPVALGAPR